MKIYSLTEKIKSEKELLGSINKLLKILSPSLRAVDDKRLKELKANPLFELYLLEIAGEIAGMASLHYMETLAKKSAWVEDVVVHPKHQGKGLGTKIMKHVVEKARKKGVKHVDLTSSPQRIAANELYKKIGFEPRDTNVYRRKLKK
jgi:GNAT superfamily N-acetyltransferase